MRATHSKGLQVRFESWATAVRTQPYTWDMHTLAGELNHAAALNFISLGKDILVWDKMTTLSRLGGLCRKLKKI